MSTEYRQRIDQACRLLEDRIDEDVPLEDVARAAHLSEIDGHFGARHGSTRRGDRVSRADCRFLDAAGVSLV